MKPREQRQAEAQERQAERDRRSPEQQLAVLNGRPGGALRERATLSVAADAGKPAYELIKLRRRGRGVGLKKKEMAAMTSNQLASAVEAAERAKRV